MDGWFLKGQIWGCRATIRIQFLLSKLFITRDGAQLGFLFIIHYLRKALNGVLVCKKLFLSCGLTIMVSELLLKPSFTAKVRALLLSRGMPCRVKAPASISILVFHSFQNWGKQSYLSMCISDGNQSCSKKAATCGGWVATIFCSGSNVAAIHTSTALRSSIICRRENDI